MKARALWSCLKVRAFWSRLIVMKFSSLKRGEAICVVITEFVVGLVGVDEEQSGSPEIMLTFWLRMKAQALW